MSRNAEGGKDGPAGGATDLASAAKGAALQQCRKLGQRFDDMVGLHRGGGQVVAAGDAGEDNHAGHAELLPHGDIAGEAVADDPDVARGEAQALESAPGEVGRGLADDRFHAAPAAALQGADDGPGVGQLAVRPGPGRVEVGGEEPGAAS